ncbi:MAG TPA: mechanosensitive ion channel family protein [Steroidobacteraceae bacterium]|nr:mechanosensitive ion channel family protein [Steroidobacteraceae bacterium]
MNIPTLQAVWHSPFLNNTLGEWTLGVITFLVTLTVLPLIRRYIAARRRRSIEQGREQSHNAVELVGLLAERTRRLFLWSVALYLGSRYLELPPRIERATTFVIVTMFWFQVALWAMAAVRFSIDAKRARSDALDTVLSGSIDVILFAAGLIIWSMALLLALDNLGVQIKPLLAGLGIGGIAIALAVQTVLSDLLASMTIALDKPFGIGDSLAVDNMQGTVEHIGVKSTRLRSISGEQIIVANADIVKARVRNYGRMVDRRAVFQFSLSYDTDVGALAAIPAEVRRIVEGQPKTRFDRCHFLNYGDSGLQYEVVYFVTTPDYIAYADIQQAINLAILQKFRELSVQFSAPTRALVYIDNTGASHPAAPAAKS